MNRTGIKVFEWSPGPLTCGQRVGVRFMETRSAKRFGHTDGISAVEKNVTALFGQKEICRNIYNIEHLKRFTR